MSYLTYLLGRHDECDIGVADSSVSRRHAEVLVDPAGSLMIVDRCSKYGTWVDDGSGWTRLTQYIARRAVKLRFGDVEIASRELLDAIRKVESGTPPALATADRPGPARNPRARMRRNPITGVVEAC